MFSLYKTHLNYLSTLRGALQKQASLFLRNIYYTENLAILDTHVIRYMELQGLHQGFKKYITKNQYIVYEKKLSAYADSLNKSLAKLDVAIWVVMRVVQRDFKWE
ncbi:putative N-glycosylase/DNA lyase [uncultured archaeon]|nr:putative N-glycosylase/DNA lyase [uncultured archaeon]